MDKFNFGNRLKQLRKSYGITQAQLAENLNERRATLSNYENKNVYPGFNMLIKLADYFHVPASLVSVRSLGELQLPDVAQAGNHREFEAIPAAFAKVRNGYEAQVVFQIFW